MPEMQRPTLIKDCCTYFVLLPFFLPFMPVSWREFKHSQVSGMQKMTNEQDRCACARGWGQRYTAVIYCLHRFLRVYRTVKTNQGDKTDAVVFGVVVVCSRFSILLISISKLK